MYEDEVTPQFLHEAGITIHGELLCQISPSITPLLQLTPPSQREAQYFFNVVSFPLVDTGALFFLKLIHVYTLYLSDGLHSPWSSASSLPPSIYYVRASDGCGTKPVKLRAFKDFRLSH